MSKLDRKGRRQKVRLRVRKKVRGSADRPRLAVHRTLNHIYCQVIDDDQGVTLTQASTADKNLRESVGRGGNIAAAQAVGKLIAERLQEKGVGNVVFDRGGFLYHGRVKALAEAAREGGIKF